ncbi:ferric reductase family protein ASCRUDRAFT_83429 [Ascoidea rubescens DSM 1968]|uniref:ferric-chelate reductase (NADPH) n=1 Tax=Ascoidea rubescens DSM 1968 TaxID=1344418 RepID=A0A1D2VPE9_9ASCO|nr:hypothetical protein ASCRUDRAFT_83429 [Ascoidea rubescens DSM 1968]ODV63476.1 hypothetical protein ASCRUDRAFT_83429 [Ascoidea rubescens DSM 1968]
MFDYKFNNNSQLFGPKVFQVTRFLADRAGILAFAHLPLLILLAGRNNLTILLTGLPYKSLIMYHKWTSRMMFLNSTFHGILYSLIEIKKGSYLKSFKTDYFFWGVFSTIVCGILMFQSLHFFRNHYYEIFLYGHILFAGIFFLFIYYHCKRLGWHGYIHLSVLFWASDRVIRIINIIRFGFPIAKIRYLSDDTFKVTIKRRKNWKPFPGCYIFIYFLKGKNFYQSHPFSIIDSILNPNEITIYIKIKEGITFEIGEMLKKSINNNKEINIRVAVEGPYGHGPNFKNYNNILLIAGGNGIPGPLYDAINMIKKDGYKNLRYIKLIWVVKNFESIKFIYPELLRLIGIDNNNNQNKKINTNRMKNLVDIEIYMTRVSNEPIFSNTETSDKNGSLKSFKKLDSLMNELNTSKFELNDDFGNNSSSNLAAMDITDESNLITNSNSNSNINLVDLDSLLNNDVYEINEDNFKPENLNQYKILKKIGQYVTINYGKRPNFEEIILQNFKYTKGSICIVTCGNSSMCDSLRNIVAENVSKCSYQVDFFEELQVW